MPGQENEQIEDLEARQALLSETGEPTSREPSPNPDSMGANARAVGETRSKGDSIAGTIILGSLATVVGTTWAVVLSNNPSKLGWFAPHPLLQTLGLSLITYGIYTLQPTSFADPRGKAAGLSRHQIAIFCLGLPCLLVGSWSIWHNKELFGKPHITTWHGTFGAACLLWTFFQVFIGIGSVWFGGRLFGGGMKAKAVWKYHRLSGYILFPLFFSTVHLGGAWSDWIRIVIPQWWIRFLAYALAPALVVAGTFWRARSSKMKIF
ncbi:hypothetical protein D9611_004490 [Ephemerocybe angulata]|uniref:Cytochrome b561 domain-containing protein n=1 Tax=Ephemerocybe angulata TaxID=980116 RepID=A0A8H5BJG7_9AGAR|nr:hypothetical protein D9611_004490 [Tulosesus angulatus]